MLFGRRRVLAQSLYYNPRVRQRTGYFKTFSKLPALLFLLPVLTFVKSTSADPFLFAQKRPDRFLPLPKGTFGNKSCHLMTERPKAQEDTNGTQKISIII